MVEGKRIVAITGGSGFIGKPLVEAHVQRGDEVRILTRRDNRKMQGEREDIHYFQGDLLDQRSDLSTFLKNADLLYHCAAELHDETIMEALHVDGTQRLLEAAEGNIKRWVQLSSVGAYGPCQVGVINEQAPESPFGVYERTKTEADRRVKDSAEKSNMEVVLLRPSIVFGESMCNRSLAQMAWMIQHGWFFYVGQPGSLVNYVHVSDVVEALLLCATVEQAEGKTYVLSDTITLEQMVKAMSHGLGVTAPSLRLPYQPVRMLAKVLTESRLNVLTGRCRYDSTVILDDLGFSFQQNLEEAFQRYASSI